MTPTTLLALAGKTAPGVEASRAALIIIDAQNDYLDGVLPLTAIEPAIAEIGRLREWAHRQEVPVIHVQHRTGNGSGLFGTPRGAAIVPALEPVEGEEVVIKSLPNSFAATTLQEILRGKGRDQLILTGFMAHMCLDSTTRAALDLGYTNFVVASATADRDLPAPDGGIVPSAEVKRASLAALADRFAWVVADARSFSALNGEARVRSTACR